MSQPVKGTTPGRQPEAPLWSPGDNVAPGVTSKKDVQWVKQKALVLGLRALALLFSLVSFMLMVTVTNFTADSALSYVFAITLLVTIYTAVMVGISAHEVRTRQRVISPATTAWIEFSGDQILSILLISASSAAAESVIIARQIQNDRGILLLELNQITASVAMAFLAFLCLEPAALFSTYNFSLYFSKS